MSPTPAAGHDDAWEVEAGIVRPYLLTQGRTEPALPALPVEAMLTATRDGRLAAPRLPAERRRIVELCRAPVSVAEVGARLGLPLGVVRVLVADLQAEGLVRLHATRRPARPSPGAPGAAAEAAEAADELAILRRLIDHVRAIPA